MTPPADEFEFARYVRGVMSMHPEWSGTCASAMQAGISDALSQSHHDKTEWEAIAVNAMHGRIFNSNKKWLADKIEAISSRGALRWDAVLERLRE